MTVPIIKEEKEKKKILFVCTGNICRSPGAESIFAEMAKNKGLHKNFEIDSAGTTAYHIGEPADKRMQAHAIKRGYKLHSISRKFNPVSDFEHFDMIVAMDNEHFLSLKKIARKESDIQKICKMTDFRKNWNYDEIPDPYYGGEEGFELVLDLLEDSCEGLIEKLAYSK
jgi:protein-tyrosine phosphatase